MNEDVVAALSLGPDMTKDKLMQAAGRLVWLQVEEQRALVYVSCDS